MRRNFVRLEHDMSDFFFFRLFFMNTISGRNENWTFGHGQISLEIIYTVNAKTFKL